MGSAPPQAGGALDQVGGMQFVQRIRHFDALAIV